MPEVAFVIVSHSEGLAQGICELAAQMAPEVHFEAAGGLDVVAGETQAGLGTSYDKVEAALKRALEVSPGVLMLSDLGSATMTIESVLEFADEPERVRFVDAPLVEGAVAAAVKAQLGEGLDSVAQAAIEAGCRYALIHAESRSGAPSTVEEALPEKAIRVKGTATVADPVGLHARPAAVLARIASRFESEVTVDGADAISVLDLMSLGVTQGQDVTVIAEGPDAVEALAAVIATLEDPQPTA